MEERPKRNDYSDGDKGGIPWLQDMYIYHVHKLENIKGLLQWFKNYIDKQEESDEKQSIIKEIEKALDKDGI